MSEPLKAFNSCWVRAKSGDIFLGRVARNELRKDKLIVVLTPVFRLEESENELGWRIMTKRVRCEFAFENSEQIDEGDLKTEFSSSLGDRITLSVDPEDAELLIKIERETE
jgi:hypothetical protein